jgi:hypothetical protein
MEESQERAQRLIIKSDAETILKMTKAYEALRKTHEANEQQQREAGQRIEDERRGRLRNGTAA